VVVTVGALIYRGRHFLSWRRSDNLQAHIKHALSERAKDREAASQMFGAPTVTRIASAVNVLVVLLMIIGLDNRPLRLWLFAHLVIGYFMSREFAFMAQQPGYRRLSFVRKLWYRLFYSAIWPVITFTHRK
jgi:4-hydroxybenzoate polyprenyltransferase